LVSSAGSDFNYDFGVSFTDEQLLQGATYNFRTMPPIPADELDQWPRDLPGTSAFVLDGDEVFHTYSSYARGGDALWSMYQWLDRAPGGRNEAPAGSVCTTGRTVVTAPAPGGCLAPSK